MSSPLLIFSSDVTVPDDGVFGLDEKHDAAWDRRFAGEHACASVVHDFRQVRQLNLSVGILWVLQKRGGVVADQDPSPRRRPGVAVGHAGLSESAPCFRAMQGRGTRPPIVGVVLSNLYSSLLRGRGVVKPLFLSSSWDLPP
ncbi:Os03g0779150 [Oryza sativa Japonica Group]|uniref:Os03g0779150 protein n=1 Tax=Oryza sativa subsp. japonica TaxID=39947 RepID=A0A0P0W3R4_ORYSJ|nr:Os03g0779150 [Oryza sativa Japonica Group]